MLCQVSGNRLGKEGTLTESFHTGMRKILRYFKVSVDISEKNKMSSTELYY